MLKNKLRKEFSLKRNSIPEEERKTASEIICRKILSSEEYKNAETVAGFYPTGSEVNIVPVLQDAAKNKVLLLPVCIDDGIIVFKRTENPDLLIKGKYNIMQPPENSETVDVEKIDFMLVPGLVFGKDGSRIGYGGGYYDRVMCRLNPHCITCGVGYGVQRTDESFAQAHDVRVKKFISEEK